MGMAMITSYPQDWKEARRLRAFNLAQQGWKQCEIATALGVSRPAVSQWLASAREFGWGVWRAPPPTGAPPKLTSAQPRLIPEFLCQGAEADGFRGEVLTCARIAQIIKGELGVSYSKSHVSRLLKKIEWTPQKPLERATHRDESRIKQWRTEVGPELKRRPVESAQSVCSLMSRGVTGCPLCLRLMLLVGRHRYCKWIRPETLCR